MIAVNSENLVIRSAETIVFTDDGMLIDGKVLNRKATPASVDIYDVDLPDGWEAGICTYTVSDGLQLIPGNENKVQENIDRVAAEALKKTQAQQKINGIEILGVMCSATKEDQNGLTAICTAVIMARGAGQTFPDTAFEFQNGNTLTITDSNFDTVYGLWVPFRQSFFAAD